MPLEISEIGVRLAVGSATASNGEPQPATPALTPEQVDTLVETCTQRVLAELKAREAR